MSKTATASPAVCTAPLEAKIGKTKIQIKIFVFVRADYAERFLRRVSLRLVPTGHCRAPSTHASALDSLAYLACSDLAHGIDGVCARPD
jgi:hypothetical protein